MNDDRSKALVPVATNGVKPAGNRLSLIDGIRDGVKQFFGTGVQFVGGVGPFREVIYLNEEGPHRNADQLSRSIAMATSVYAYVAIMYRASKVAEPPFMVIAETEDGEQWVQDHELIPLLEQPNADLDMRELVEQTEIYRLVTGGAIWTVEYDSVGRIGRLVPWSRESYETKSKDGRIYGEFKITAPIKGPKLWKWEDVIHFRDSQPRTWHGALSRLDVALQQLDLGHQINRTIHNFVRKAMFPGGVLSPHQEWDPSDDEWNRYKATVKAYHGGPANAGDPLILAGGTTFSRSAIPLKELLPDDLLDRIEAAISSVFGIPPIVMGWLVGLKNSPWSQMSEARLTCYDETIIPRWGDYTQRLTRRLLSDEDRAAGRAIAVDTSGIRALQRDTNERATTAAAMRQEWTRNERRIYTGQEPLKKEDPRGEEIEGGNALGNAIAGLFAPDMEAEDTGGVGAAVETALNGAQITAAVEVLRAVASGEIAEVPAIELLVAVGIERDIAETMVRQQALHAEPPGGGGDGKGSKVADPLNFQWAVFDFGTKASERAWRTEIARQLTGQQKEIVRLARKHLHESKAIDNDSARRFKFAVRAYLDDEGKIKIGKAALPLLKSTGEAAIRQAAGQLGLSFSVLQPALAKYAEREAKFLASVMGRTTGKAVARAIQAGLDKGETITKLVKRLEGMKAFDKARAFKVARTETTRAWNGAQRASLSDYATSNKATVIKGWLSSRDDRVRDEHEELDGEEQKIDDEYSNGLMEPGEPNCRCTMVYRIEE